MGTYLRCHTWTVRLWTRHAITDPTKDGLGSQIRQHKQDIINVNNRKENEKRIAHKYRVGDKVLLEKPGLISKLSAPCTGPYRITHSYTNGTVHVQRGIVNERVNIRRLTPYKECALPN
jgi:hypothetical protein